MVKFFLVVAGSLSACLGACNGGYWGHPDEEFISPPRSVVRELVPGDPGYLAGERVRESLSPGLDDFNVSFPDAEGGTPSEWAQCLRLVMHTEGVDDHSYADHAAARYARRVGEERPATLRLFSLALTDTPTLLGAALDARYFHCRTRYGQPVEFIPSSLATDSVPRQGMLLHPYVTRMLSFQPRAIALDAGRPIGLLGARFTGDRLAPTGASVLAYYVFDPSISGGRTSDRCVWRPAHALSQEVTDVVVFANRMVGYK